MKHLLSIPLILILIPFSVNRSFGNDEYSKTLAPKPGAIIDSIPWDSGEIFSIWLKPTTHQNRIQLFINLALKGYLQAPNYKAKGFDHHEDFIFEHFAWGGQLHLAPNTPPDILEKVHSEFPIFNLAKAQGEGKPDEIAGYVVGFIPASPQWILENFYLSGGKFLDDPMKEKFERVDLSIEDGSVVSVHKLPNPGYVQPNTTYVRIKPWGGWAPKNMMSRQHYKVWSDWWRDFIEYSSGMTPKDLNYRLNNFYQTLEDGTVIFLYGLANMEGNPVQGNIYGEVDQNVGGLVLRPVDNPNDPNSKATMAYFVWFFQGDSYSALSADKINQYLLTKNTVISELSRVQEFIDNPYDPGDGWGW